MMSKQCSFGEMKNVRLQRMCFQTECGQMKHLNVCVHLCVCVCVCVCVSVCVCVCVSGTVQAHVLPLEQICGLMGQMGLSIASEDTAHCTSGQHDIGRASF